MMVLTFGPIRIIIEGWINKEGDKKMKNHLRALLVAPVPDNSENLSLGYVATALNNSGHKTAVEIIRGIYELEQTADKVAQQNPDLLTSPAALSGMPPVSPAATPSRRKPVVPFRLERSKVEV